MNQKTNIFEELNKMKNLINVKAGTVISEQASNVGTDVGSVMQELNKTNSDESKIVNTVKKYKSKAEFDNFLSQYKSISGKDFGIDVFRAIQPYNDKTEWNDLKTHLGTLGITLGSSTQDKGRTGLATFGGASGSVKPPVTPEELQRREGLWKTTFKCVPAQPGVKSIELKDKTHAYLLNGVYYYNMGRKKLADGSMASYSCSTEFKTKQKGSQSTNTTPSNIKKIQSNLGLPPTGQFDEAQLTKILASLGQEGENINNEISQSIPKTSTGEIDLEKILSSL